MIPLTYPNIANHYLIDECGHVFSVRKNKMIGSKTDLGYFHTSLEHTDGSRRFYLNHRLCAHQFVGECPAGMEVNHKDGDKMNNHYSNLEYVTHSENIKHSFDKLGRVGYWKGKNKPSPSAETKVKMSVAKHKPVEHYYNNEFVMAYNSVADLLFALNINRKAFNRTLHKGTHKGNSYKFIQTPRKNETNYNIINTL